MITIHTCNNNNNNDNSITTIIIIIIWCWYDDDVGIDDDKSDVDDYNNIEIVMIVMMMHDNDNYSDDIVVIMIMIMIPCGPFNYEDTISPSHSSATKKRQSNRPTWTNDDPSQWHIYAPPGPYFCSVLFLQDNWQKIGRKNRQWQFLKCPINSYSNQLKLVAHAYMPTLFFGLPFLVGLAWINNQVRFLTNLRQYNGISFYDTICFIQNSHKHTK